MALTPLECSSPLETLQLLLLMPLADLSDGSKLALSVAVLILNISCVLSFDAELKIYAALSKDAGDENSAYAKNSRETPWGVFRVFCLVICVVAAVAQLMAING